MILACGTSAPHRSVGARTRNATSTSDFGVTLSGDVSPGEVTVTFAPIAPGALSCRLYFGGWPASQRNAVRVPIAAGFDTHVAMACTSAVDAGARDSGSDGAVDASGD